MVESYRNENGRVCQRTVVNAGYLDDLNTDQLVVIQKFITEKAENCNNPLFTYQESDDSLVNKYVDEFRFDDFLEKQGWNEHDINLSPPWLPHVSSRVAIKQESPPI